MARLPTVCILGTPRMHPPSTPTRPNRLVMCHRPSSVKCRQVISPYPNSNLPTCTLNRRSQSLRTRAAFTQIFTTASHNSSLPTSFAASDTSRQDYTHTHKFASASIPSPCPAASRCEGRGTQCDTVVIAQGPPGEKLKATFERHLRSRGA